MTKRLRHANKGINGELTVPGDKSITHRAVMLGSIAKGETIITNYLDSEDCQNTIAVFLQMGVKIIKTPQQLFISGRTLKDLKPPKKPFLMGNSGTTTRLLLGLLAKQNFSMNLVGDNSLTRRPLKRVTDPLQIMGAKILTDEDHLPAKILPNNHLKGIEYTLPIASAQVKSAIILAALQADRRSVIRESLVSRDHTERMLGQFGVNLKSNNNQIVVEPNTNLKGTEINVPGDFSSAAFWIVASLITPKSELLIKQVGVNPTRTGLLNLLERMGAVIEIKNIQNDFEKYADIKVVSQSLKGIKVGRDDIPQAVDEIPLLVLAATQAKGATLIEGAGELRVKETDRIKTVTQELNKLGAKIEARLDGFWIPGSTKLEAKRMVELDSHGDHRIGMMLAIAALITKGDVILKNASVVGVSYPSFFTDLKSIINN